MWVHQKYGISQINKLDSVKSNDWNYLTVHKHDVMNWQNYVTYDLEFTNGKIIMTITIMTNLMRINCSDSYEKTETILSV